MKVIKTPTGLIPVDEPAKLVTQTEYNNMPEEEQKSGTYYIINGDGTAISLIIKDGIPLDQVPAQNIDFNPPDGMQSITIQDAITENYNLINKMKPITVNATAIATDWGGTSAPYVCMVLVNGVTASNIVEVGLSNSATDDETKACMKASIAKITQDEGKIFLYAYGKKPTINLPLTCVIVNT